MLGSGENLPSAAALEAGWGTLSAGAQLGAKLGAKKANASAELEAWQPPRGAGEKPARASSAAGLPRREGWASRWQGAVGMHLIGNGWADLCVNVRHEGPGWGTAQHPPGQPPLHCCPTALPSALGTPMAPWGLRTMLSSSLALWHVCAPWSPSGLAPCSPQPSAG